MFWKPIRSLVSSVIRRPKFEREMSEELRFHIDARTNELQSDSGMSPGDARLQALREFGSTDKYKEEARQARGLRMLDELSGDLRYAVRMLRKYPMFTFASVTILGLGIGVNTAVFSVVDIVFLKPLPFSDPSQLVMVWEESGKLGYAHMDVSAANYRDWKDQSNTFQSLAAYGSEAFNLIGEGTPERLDGISTTTNLFPLFGVRPRLGRWFEDSEQGQKVTILSYGLWRRKFGGDSAIVGRSILINNQAHIVVGVMPEGFQFPRADIQLWLPSDLNSARLSARDLRFLSVVGRLKPDVSPHDAESDVRNVARKLAKVYPGTNRDWSAVIVPLQQEFARDVRASLWLLLGASLLVLLIACANVANMLITRGIGRNREIAVRSAIGASRQRVARQLFVEGLVLSIAGAVAGLLLASATMPLLEVLIPPALEGAVRLSLNGRLLIFALLISLLTAIGFGLVPLREMFRVDLSEAFRGSRITAGMDRSRGFLVSFETALAVVVLVCTGLLIRTIVNIQAVDPGFRSENVLTLRLELPYPQYSTVEQKVSFYKTVLDRIHRIPSVGSAGFTTFLPYTNTVGAVGVFLEGRPDLRSNPPTFWLREVTADYLQTVRVPLRTGRWFTEDDNQGHPLVAIISENAARLFEGNPIGKRVRIGDQGPFTIVGVTGDIRNEGIERPAQRPTIYTPASQAQRNWFFNPRDLAIRVQGDPTSIIDAVQHEIWSVDRNQTIARLRTLDDVVEQQISGRKVHATLLSAFSILSVLLAALGIYALLSFVVEAKKREFGIRLAIGAPARDLVLSIFRQSLLWITTGALLGVALALVITQSFATLLYGVEPTDPLTLTGSVLLLFAIGICAACVPAWRATRVDPMIALRHE